MKTLKIVAAIAAVLAMGISMPSCPGQQAMQQQVDALQTSNTDLNKRFQSFDSQLRTLKQDNEQMKGVIQQMASAIEAQKTALNKMDEGFKAMSAKPAA